MKQNYLENESDCWINRLLNYSDENSQLLGNIREPILDHVTACTLL